LSIPKSGSSSSFHKSASKDSGLGEVSAPLRPPAKRIDGNNVME
jgi:hypothetical protein